MLSVFFWLAFGSMVGWVAAILQEEALPRRVSAYVITGAVGGLVGGLGGGLLGAVGPSSYQSTTDIMFAVFGAVAFVFLAGYTASKHKSSE